MKKNIESISHDIRIKGRSKITTELPMIYTRTTINQEATTMPKRKKKNCTTTTSKIPR